MIVQLYVIIILIIYYSGILLLSIVRKAFAQVIFLPLAKACFMWLFILSPSAALDWADVQCMTDMIFSLHVCQVHCTEVVLGAVIMPLYIAFINLTKVFNLIN